MKKRKRKTDGRTHTNTNISFIIMEKVAPCRYATLFRLHPWAYGALKRIAQCIVQVLIDFSVPLWRHL